LLARYPDKFIYAEDNDTNYIFQQIGFPAMWDMNSPFAFARALAHRDLSQIQSLITRPGYPAAWSAIRYLLGSHDQIFNQWEYDNTSRTWGWDKPGAPDLRENRYFVELIGGPIIGRQNWYALAQARMGWALNIAIPGTPMLFMGTEVQHYGYWNPALDPFGDHRFEWAIAGDPTGLAMRNLVADANNVRWNNPALRTDFGPSIPHFDSANNVLGFLRWDDSGNVILTVVNLSDNQWDDSSYGINIGGTGDSWEEVQLAISAVRRLERLRNLPRQPGGAAGRPLLHPSAEVVGADLSEELTPQGESARSCRTIGQCQGRSRSS
jgi:1,4-alpha-glucan branching enzyme